uniref:NAD(P)H-dependent oxidoreductase n=1 Tax=Pseudomonas aeruginosa TaxID=287 RepID=UPI001ABC4196
AGQPTGAAHEGYLRTVLGFFGITDIEVVRAEGLAYGEEPRAQAIAAARRQIAGQSPRPDPRVIGKPRFGGVFALCAAARCV